MYPLEWTQQKGSDFRSFLHSALSDLHFCPSKDALCTCMDMYTRHFSESTRSTLLKTIITSLPYGLARLVLTYNPKSLPPKSLHPHPPRPLTPPNPYIRILYTVPTPAKASVTTPSILAPALRSACLGLLQEHHVV